MERREVTEITGLYWAYWPNWVSPIHKTIHLILRKSKRNAPAVTRRDGGGPGIYGLPSVYVDVDI